MPAPKVDSSVIRMDIRPEPENPVSDEKLFFKMVHAAFGQRRKTASNSISSGSGIPKDIVIEFWNGGGKSVYQKLLDQGFETINANYPYTYVDFPQYMQDEKIKLWNTHTEFLDEKELVGNIIGGEMCAWELGNPLYSFYPCTLPVCMALFADRV